MSYGMTDDFLSLHKERTEPVARVTGYYAGRCVIEPLDQAAVLPTGMALYAAPAPAVPPGYVLVPADDGRCPTCGEDGGTSCGIPNCGLLVDVDDQPVTLTDEQIAAALKAWFATPIQGKTQPFEGRMRAAFAAAYGITTQKGTP